MRVGTSLAAKIENSSDNSSPIEQSQNSHLEKSNFTISDSNSPLKKQHNLYIETSIFKDSR